MKITLEFDDQEEAETAIKGGEYFSALREIWRLLRNKDIDDKMLRVHVEDAIEDLV